MTEPLVGTNQNQTCLTKMVRRYLFSLCTLVCLCLSPHRADACSCLKGTAPCEAYKTTQAIFIAQVTAIGPDSDDADVPQYAHLSVEHAFKGISESKIRMYQGTGTGDCSFVFETGKRYLLYADYSSETNQFHTSICTRSAPIEYAAEDLWYLRGLPSANLDNSLTGIVVNYDYVEDGIPSIPDLISDVKVVATDGGNRFEAVTNIEGFYKILNLPSGRYDVRAELPPNLTLSSQKPMTVNVPAVGCATASFLTRTDGRISGILQDAQGKVAAETTVDLLPLEFATRLGDRRLGRLKTTDKDGRFEFSELRPGRYLLGVNIRSNPDGDTPYPRTFFPGVISVGEATVITLGRGEKLSGYDFRLPRPLPVRIIKGVLLDLDGKPITKALISLKDTANSIGGENLDLAEVDKQGRFSLKALEGTVGWVHASVAIQVESGLDLMIAEPVKVVAGPRIDPVRLVLSRKSPGGLRIIQ